MRQTFFSTASLALSFSLASALGFGGCRGPRPAATLAASPTTAPVEKTTPSVPHKGLEGAWQGTLEMSGQDQTLFLTISKSSEGVYSGKLNNVDLGVTHALNRITVNGDSIRLEISSVGAVFEGALVQTPLELRGKFTAGGASFPIVLSAVSEELAAAAKASIKPGVRMELDIPWEVIVPIAPSTFRADGKTHLVYELHVTNLGAVEQTLTGLEILDSDGKIVARYEGSDLSDILARRGMPAGPDRGRLARGQRTLVYVWIVLDASAEQAPKTLRHRFHVKTGESPETHTLDCARIAVDRGGLTLHPPLRGGRWQAFNGPANTSNHRRAVLVTAGHSSIAQRFAIDWLKLGDDGQTFTGDSKDNKSYYAYGAEVISASNGTVVTVKDGIPDNVPGLDSRAVPITIETLAGNLVIVDLGKNRYVVYSHLQPGSIRVKVGQRVRRGQLLALVGNSGNSTEPHLHFHVHTGNADSWINSEGIPYVLSEFEEHAGSEASAPLQKRRMELPLHNDVVRFPQ